MEALRTCGCMYEQVIWWKKYKFNLCVFLLVWRDGSRWSVLLYMYMYSTRVPVTGIRCGRSCMGPPLIRGMDGVWNRNV